MIPNLKEDDITEAHSATDGAWHWLKLWSIGYWARNSHELRIELTAVYFHVPCYWQFEAEHAASQVTIGLGVPVLGCIYLSMHIIYITVKCGWLFWQKLMSSQFHSTSFSLRIKKIECRSSMCVWWSLFVHVHSYHYEHQVKSVWLYIIIIKISVETRFCVNSHCVCYAGSYAPSNEGKT